MDIPHKYGIQKRVVIAGAGFTGSLCHWRYCFVAWFVWMLVHLMSIIGIKNRLFVLINWIWQYVTYDQSLRLIINPSLKNSKIKVYEKNTNSIISNKSLAGL